jgi:hypothetical protein
MGNLWCMKLHPTQLVLPVVLWLGTLKMNFSNSPTPEETQSDDGNEIVCISNSFPIKLSSCWRVSVAFPSISYLYFHFIRLSLAIFPLFRLSHCDIRGKSLSQLLFGLSFLSTFSPTKRVVCWKEFAQSRLRCLSKWKTSKEAATELIMARLPRKLKKTQRIDGNRETWWKQYQILTLPNDKIAIKLQIRHHLSFEDSFPIALKHDYRMESSNKRLENEIRYRLWRRMSLHTI